MFRSQGALERTVVICVLAIALFVPLNAAAQNLIQDPGFEEGGADWTFVNGAGVVEAPPGNPLCGNASHTGDWAAFVNRLGQDGPYGSVTQTVPTTVGQSYRVSFWVAGNCAGGGSLTVSFGNNQISWSDYGADVPYTEYGFLAKATSNSTTFSFSGQNLTGTYFLDDVTVVAATNAPPIPTN
jgi:hypothetical protein